MKNIILIFTYIAIGALALGIIVSAMGRESRNVELQSNLSNIVEETLANAMEEKNYTVADQNEFLADITQSLAETLDTNSTVDVKVMKSDLNKGLLSIRVTQTFGYVNGKNGSVQCDRTVLFEKRGAEDGEKFDLYYYINADDEKPYKRYTLLKGDTVMIPRSPSRAGYTFEGWKDADGNAPFADATVEEAKTYYAQWSGSGVVPADADDVEFEDFSAMGDGEGILADGSVTGDGSAQPAGEPQAEGSTPVSKDAEVSGNGQSSGRQPDAETQSIPAGNPNGTEAGTGTGAATSTPDGAGAVSDIAGTADAGAAAGTEAATQE